MKTRQTKLTLNIYYDTQDPSNKGWAYSIFERTPHGDTYDTSGSLWARRQDCKITKLRRQLSVLMGPRFPKAARCDDAWFYNSNIDGWTFKQ